MDAVSFSFLTLSITWILSQKGSVHFEVSLRMDRLKCCNNKKDEQKTKRSIIQMALVALTLVH